MGDNILEIESGKFSFEIPNNGRVYDAQMLDTQIKTLSDICGVNIKHFTNDKLSDLTFSLSGRYEEYVEKLKQDMVNRLNEYSITIANSKRPKKLPRKLKKAYKNSVPWAVSKINRRYPTYRWRNCVLHLDFGKDNDYTSVNKFIKLQTGEIVLCND